jgi:hypothetical protein
MNCKRGLNRLFVVGSVLWIACWAFAWSIGGPEWGVALVSAISVPTLVYAIGAALYWAIAGFVGEKGTATE